MLLCCIILFNISCSNKSNIKLIPVKSDEKWGYINKKGEYVINPQFKDADFFRDGLAKVTGPDGKVGFIDEKGKYKIATQYKDATPFSDGLAFVVNDGGYPTCIDKSGKTIFTLKQAKHVTSFKEDLAIFVTKDMKFGYVDKTGKVIINAQFDQASYFCEGLAAVKIKDKCGFIDKKGKIVINPQFEIVSDFSEGKAFFKNGKQYGYIDQKGAYVINPQFDRAGQFSEGMASIMSGKVVGYIMEDGKIEINPQFDFGGEFKSGLALVSQNEKFGFIDKTGKIVINPQFEDASSFFGDIAFVKSAEKWGVIDKEGKYIVNPQFDNVIQNFDGFFYVTSDYYDASAFISSFFKKAGDNLFDGFNNTSTLQNVVDNPIYSNLNAESQFIAYTLDDQIMTNDILITTTSFHFTNPIFENITNYSSYYGYSYETGTSKQYKFSETVSAIEYNLEFSNEAEEKGGAIASALKSEIESRYNLNMEIKENQYVALQDNKWSFAIFYDDNYCSIIIAFNKAKLQEIINTKSELIDESEL
ncbi:MAG: hypothetical protein H6Q25_850 [Bacteroidetes bacterium]|nr:hypothetical protein [Bacteroidota bacterium]